MTRRCPHCGKTLLAHLDGRGCNLLHTTNPHDPDPLRRTRRPRS